MTETLINPNQINLAKILNVVETGSLTVDGSEISGFSLDDYLQLGNRLNKGYLDLANNALDFVSIVSQADNWEMVFKFSYVASNESQILFTEGTTSLKPLNACQIGIDGGKFYIGLGNDDGYFIDIESTTTLVEGTDYWGKIVFTGTAYQIFLSTDGVNYTLESSQNSSSKITRESIWIIGCYNSEHPLILVSPLDLSGCYLKADGEIVWKGVETL